MSVWLDRRRVPGLYERANKPFTAGDNFVQKSLLNVFRLFNLNFERLFMVEFHESSVYDASENIRVFAENPKLKIRQLML